VLCLYLDREGHCHVSRKLLLEFAGEAA